MSRKPLLLVASPRGSSQIETPFLPALLLVQHNDFQRHRLGFGQCNVLTGGTLMRRLSIGIGLALSLCAMGPANAYERPFAWTGLYIGLNAGYSWGKASADVDVTSSERTRVFRAFGLPAQTLVSDVTVAGRAEVAAAQEMSTAGLAAATLATIGNRSVGCMASKPISSGLARTVTLQPA